MARDKVTGDGHVIHRDNIDAGIPSDGSLGTTRLKQADAKRKDLGGTTDETREAHWGDKAVDLWDGDISEGDLQAVQNAVAKAIESGGDPMDVYRNIIDEGKNEPGVGVVFRQDKWTEFLSGRVSSAVLLAGTATEGVDGSKQAGPGVRLEGQFEYQVSPRELQSWVDQAKESGANVVVVPDQDEYGQTLQPKVRLNLSAMLKEDGLYEIKPSLRVENIPAINLMELIKDAKGDKLEVPWLPLLSLLDEKGLAANVQFQGADGMSMGIKTTVAKLHAMTGERFVENDKVPDLAVQGNVDGTVTNIDGKNFLDLGTFDISLGRIRAVRKGEVVQIEYETPSGEFKKLDPSKYVPEEMKEMLKDGDVPFALLSGLLGQVLG